MKRYLNTLFVTTQDTWLSKQGECVELHHDGQRLGTIPLHTLQSIACFGRVSCSPYLLEHCAALGVTVSWFSESGRFMASVQGPTRGNVLLRRAQYRATDSPRQTADLARSFLIGKVANCRTILMRQARNAPLPALSAAIESLGHTLQAAPPGRRPGDPARAGRRCRPDILRRLRSAHPSPMPCRGHGL